MELVDIGPYVLTFASGAFLILIRDKLSGVSNLDSKYVSKDTCVVCAKGASDRSQHLNSYLDSVSMKVDKVAEDSASTREIILKIAAKLDVGIGD